MASLRKMNGLRLYGRYIRLHFLSGLQYKGWPLLFLHTIVVVVTDPIGTLFLFRRFGSIDQGLTEAEQARLRELIHRRFHRRVAAYRQGEKQWELSSLTILAAAGRKDGGGT